MLWNRATAHGKEGLWPLCRRRLGEYCQEKHTRGNPPVPPAGFYFDVKKEFKVNRLEFNPVPNVDSEVISFTRKKELLKLKDKELFFKLVKDSFKFKRKNIRNNLKGYNLDIIDRVLKNNNLDLTSRAEQLPIEVFVEMSNKLS